MWERKRASSSHRAGVPSKPMALGHVSHSQEASKRITQIFQGKFLSSSVLSCLELLAKGKIFPTLPPRTKRWKQPNVFRLSYQENGWGDFSSLIFSPNKNKQHSASTQLQGEKNDSSFSPSLPSYQDSSVNEKQGKQGEREIILETVKKFRAQVFNLYILWNYEI